MPQPDPAEGLLLMISLSHGGTLSSDFVHSLAPREPAIQKVLAILFQLTTFLLSPNLQ
jgi:hypothetical protein